MSRTPGFCASRPGTRGTSRYDLHQRIDSLAWAWESRREPGRRSGRAAWGRRGQRQSALGPSPGQSRDRRPGISSPGRWGHGGIHEPNTDGGSVRHVGIPWQGMPAMLALRRDRCPSVRRHRPASKARQAVSQPSTTPPPSATPSPAGRSGRYSRPGSARDSPGVRIRRPRTGRPARPRSRPCLASAPRSRLRR